MDEMIEVKVYLDLIMLEDVENFCATMVKNRNSLAAIKWTLEQNELPISKDTLDDFLVKVADYFIGQIYETLDAMDEFKKCIDPSLGEGEEQC
jgi:hypothetical protein